MCWIKAQSGPVEMRREPAETALNKLHQAQRSSSHTLKDIRESLEEICERVLERFAYGLRREVAKHLHPYPPSTLPRCLPDGGVGKTRKPPQIRGLLSSLKPGEGSGLSLSEAFGDISRIILKG